MPLRLLKPRMPSLARGKWIWAHLVFRAQIRFPAVQRCTVAVAGRRVNVRTVVVAFVFWEFWGLGLGESQN